MDRSIIKRGWSLNIRGLCLSIPFNLFWEWSHPRATSRCQRKSLLIAAVANGTHIRSCILFITLSITGIGVHRLTLWTMNYTFTMKSSEPDLFSCCPRVFTNNLPVTRMLIREVGVLPPASHLKAIFGLFSQGRPLPNENPGRPRSGSGEQSVVELTESCFS